MKLVALLKEKSQQIQLSNGEFIKRFEPQVRELRESFNQSVSNSFASAWFSRLLAVANEEEHINLPPIPEVLALKDRLTGKLGAEIHISGWHTVTQACIDGFAEVTGDHQWIHVDECRAKVESPYKSTVAHGFLILSLLPRLRGLDSYAKEHYAQAKLVVNCGLNNVKFLSPVKPGNPIRSRTFLRALQANKRSLDVTEEVIVEVGNGARRACTVELVTRIYF
ncbi:MaoC family dehydratase [Teredinibacter haidensis]|uniref:MaoC family dehydratase n=1 Tax=Teredinibacter haidensis TaxID=2731755 RepID=UPI000948B944|nr:MaoC family dehydratase [Teredinibacter haidensis]